MNKNGGATLSQVESSRIDYQGQDAFQFFFREVTDRARLEQQLRQAEKLSSLGQMISGVAHELNNPLSVIKGYLDLIVAHHEMTPQTRADLEKSPWNATGRPNWCAISSPLPASSPPGAKWWMSTPSFSAWPICAAPTLTPPASNWFLDLAAGLPSTSADPDQVQQLIINLLNNAMQAMAASPAPRTLRITTRMSAPDTL